jgi:hypothetical protein
MMSRRRELAGKMGAAAGAFLESLDERERREAAWSFPADHERRLWFYTPTDHGGVVLGDLDPAQQRLAMRLVASGLSRPGYVTVSTIMGLENVLDELEGWSTMWGGQRGRDPNRYYLRVFGDPGSDSHWGWRFGGHHVSINITVVDGEVEAVTPCFLGADPASSPLLGHHPLRPLAGAEDLGRQLVRSLNASQREKAILSPVAPTDIVGANRALVSDGDLPLSLADIWRDRFDGEMGERIRGVQEQAERDLGLGVEHLDAVRLSAVAKGVEAGQLDGFQQELLRALLDVYLGRIPDALAEEEAAKYSGERLAAFAFAWAGGLEPDEPHYYRVHGPRLLVEYDNTQRDVNHVHTVWRDPEGDFGADVLRTHRLSSDHS